MIVTVKQIASVVGVLSDVAELRRLQTLDSPTIPDAVARDAIAAQLDKRLDESDDAIAALRRVLSDSAQGAAAVREPVDDPNRGTADQVAGDVPVVVKRRTPPDPSNVFSVNSNGESIGVGNLPALALRFNRSAALNLAAWLFVLAESLPAGDDPTFADFVSAIRSPATDRVS